MASAGQGGLDPRQVKAREEFQRMREQLRRTLERTGEPAPWRERALTPDYAEFRKEARRTRPRLGARTRRGKLMGVVGLAAGAFAAGAAVAAAATWIVTRQDQPTAPELETAAVAPAPADVAVLEPPASRVTLSNFEIRRAPAAEREIVAAAAVEPSPPPAAAVAPAVVEPEPAVDEAPARLSLTLEGPGTSSEPELVDAPPAGEPEITVTLAEAGDPESFELVTLEEPADAEDLELVAPEPSVTEPSEPAASGDPVVARILRIREIQSLLAAQGYDVGRADGDAGPQTERAAQAFASAQGLADANLDAALLALLRATRAGVTTRPPVETNPVIVRVQRVREMQDLLNQLGYEVGRADGDAGPQTLAAVASFASSNGLADANIDDALVALLRERAAQ